MKLTREQVFDLLENYFPRHIRDVGVAQFTTDKMDDANLLLVFDQVLLDGNPMYGDPITSAHTMSVQVARTLHNQLGQVIDMIDGHDL